MTAGQLMAESYADVVQEHASEAAYLWEARQRRLALASPQYTLRHAIEHDGRIEAHLDGLRVAGGKGVAVCRNGLTADSPGSFFAATVLALEHRAGDVFKELCAVAAAAPEVHEAFGSALGWVSPALLRGVVVGLLESASPELVKIGIAACAWHRIDPGRALHRHFDSGLPPVQACVLRATGEIGATAWKQQCLEMLLSPDPDVRYFAARSALLFGLREPVLPTLQALASEPTPWQRRAFRLALLALNPSEGQAFVRGCAGVSNRMKVEAVGLMGQVQHVPWLIECMADPLLARIAGEAFSAITGVDLAFEDLDIRPAPEQDEEAESPEDDGLPWPDPQRVAAWWNRNAARYPTGVRLFCGAPLSPQQCMQVLKSGYHRQRICAALHLALSRPGTALFEWRAPAWRQVEAMATLK
jgi:uncharacterized protein (TIGR02270 family)